VGVSGEFSGVEDGEVNSFGEFRIEFGIGGSDHHLLHEDGVIGASGSDSYLEPVLRVPANISVDNEKLNG